jgi:nucleotide-binding universal stress UspA family protein
VTPYADVVKGGPLAEALAEESTTADLLVLGARRPAAECAGRGGMVVGPALRSVLQNAACSVVVVPSG